MEGNTETAPFAAGQFAVERLPVVAVAVLSALALTALAIGNHPAPVWHSFVPLIAAGMLITNLIAAYVLSGRALDEGDPAWVILATAYVLSGLLFGTYALTDPYFFAAGGLLHVSKETAVAIWSAGHVAFPILVGAYALRRQFQSGCARRQVMRCIRMSIVASVIVTVFVTVGLAWGFAHFNVPDSALLGAMRSVLQPLTVALDLLALIMLLTTAQARSCHRWIAVGLFASVLEALLTIACGRHTGAWYIGKFYSFVSSSAIVWFFIFELRVTMARFVTANALLVTLQERERQNALERREAEERLRDALHVAGVGTWDTIPGSGTITFSDELYAICGLPKGAPLVEGMYNSLVHPDDRAMFEETVQAHLRELRPFSIDHRIVRADGTVRWVQGTGSFVTDADGRLVRVHGAALDITERKEAALGLTYLAEHDVLTQLPNRARLERCLLEIVTAGRRHGDFAAVLFLDIDNFKTINDSLGHAAGDRALKVIAARLQSTIRREDLVARMGGDEFVVVLTHVGDRSGVEAAAQKLMRAVADPVVLEHGEMFFTASIGISCYPTDGQTPDILLSNADAALYEAKAGGRMTYRFYTPAMHASVSHRMEMERDLRLALSRGEFSLHYQPFLDLQTGEAVRAEALLRWTHPVLGNVPPSEFIPVAEACGLIPAIGDWVLENALAQLRRWQDAGRSMELSVNVSMRELAIPGFPDRLDAAIRRHGVRPHRLVIEVTETAAMADAAGTNGVLERCRKLGTRISVDDFGTHYSSLAYLASLPLDTLKIDRSFVADIPGNARGGSIVRAVIDMAESLGLSTVGGGVENEEQLEWLRRAGCRFVQGFHIARPMPPAALEVWLDGRLPVTV